MKLYRSERDKKIFGLCGGLAESFNIDPTILRLVVVISAFFSAGTTIFIYAVASMVIPKESAVNSQYIPPRHYGERPGGNPHSYQHRSHTPPRSAYERDREPAAPNLDDMMDDLEKKALRKEIEELKKQLSKYEKGDQ